MAASPAVGPTIKVFISYRRAESNGWVRVIDTRLAEALGRENVFCDIKSIEPGTDFAEELKAWLQQSDVVLVVIGDQWATLRDSTGKGPRLLRPDDLVKQEVELALQKQLTVVPVLVGNATLPAAEQLPPRMRRMLRHNAHPLSVKHFDLDLEDLIAALRRLSLRRNAAAGATAAAGLPASPTVDEEPDVADDDDRDEAEAAAPAPGQENDAAPDPFTRDVQAARAQWEAPGLDRPYVAPLRLSVTRSGDGWLFAVETTHGRLAPELFPAPVGHSALDAALKSLRQSWQTGRILQAGEVLFRMLVPHALRPLLESSTRVDLRLDDDADRLPWETLKAPSHALPLGLGPSLVRRRAGARASLRSALAVEHSALVLLGAAPGNFAPLPGARTEVEGVRDALQAAGFEVQCLLEPEPMTALEALTRGRFRSLHLSGHGVTGWLPDAPVTPGQTLQPLHGFVLADRVVLTAHEVLMQDAPPELVTLGANDIGQWPLPLLDAGCRVVVSAGEPLSDHPACDFFTAFYRQLGAGAQAYAALHGARLHTVLTKPGAESLQTALYLRFYGDAEYRLLHDGPKASR